MTARPEPSADAAGLEATGAELWAHARAIWRRVASPAVEAFAVTAILAFALTLRTTNLNWDKGQHLHPDERFLSSVAAEIRGVNGPSQYFDSPTSPLNPYNRKTTYVYGTLPLFATKSVAEWLDKDADGSTHQTGQWALRALEVAGIEFKNDDGTTSFEGGYNSNLIGRFLASLLDTATVFVVFLMGKHVFGVRAGLVGALFFAVAPLQIQYSHFFGMEPWLTFFAACAVYAAIRLAEGGGWRWWMLLGLTTGCAMASKISGASLLALIPLVVGVRMWRAMEPDDGHRGLRSASIRGVAAARRPATWGGVLLAAGLVLLTFRVFQPYAFAGSSFVDVFHWEVQRADVSLSGLIRLHFLHPDNFLQLDKRFTTDLANLRRLQAGSDFPPNVQWIGRTPYFFPLSNLALWGFGPFATVAFFAGAMRAGVLIRRHGRAELLVPLAFSVLLVAYYGREFAVTQRYFMPMLPIMAMLAGGGVLWAWDAGISRVRVRRTSISLPAGAMAKVVAGIAVVGAVLGGWAFTTGVYGREVSRIEATRWMLDEIPAGSVISHQQWDDGLPMQPPGFPKNPFVTVDLDPYGTQTRENVFEFARRLDRIEYIVESSNRLYGSIPRHPARYHSMTRYYAALEDGSLGFVKVAEFTNGPQLLGFEIDDQGAEEAFTVYDHPKVTIWRKTERFSYDRTLAILEPDRADARVNATPGDAGTNSLQLRPAEYHAQQTGGTWRQAFDTASWVSAAPWLWWILWFELLGLALLPAMTWLCRSLPDSGYGLSRVAGFAAVTMAAWGAVAWGAMDFGRELALAVSATALLLGALSWWLSRRRMVALLRANRSAWLLTEAVFLGAFFAFLLLRLQNPDTWYHPTGGEKPMEMAYLTAVARSTEMPPYDPWFAGGYLNYYYMGWFALAVPMRLLQIVPEVVFNLGIPTFAAMAASVACSVGYNLAALSKAATGAVGRRGRAAASGILAAGLVVLTGNFDAIHQNVERLQAISGWHAASGVPVLGGAVTLAGGTWSYLQGESLPRFDWWRSSRVHFGESDITEFPYWTFLFGDLHPHMMNMPFFLLTVGLGVAYIASARARERWHGWVLALGLGLTAGFVRTVHTWDYPAATLIFVASIALGQAVAPGSLRSRVALFAGHVIAGMAMARLFFAPYLADAEVFNAGLRKATDTTPPQQFLVQFGPLLVLAALFLVVRTLEERRAGTANPLIRMTTDPLTGGLMASALLTAALLASGRGVAVVLLASAAMVMLLNLAWLELRRETIDLGRLAATASLTLGLGIAAGMDMVTVKDDIGRMNTVFKFTLQAWQLMAIGAGFATWYVVGAARRGLGNSPLASRRLALLVPAACVATIAGGMLFTLQGTPVRQDARFGETGLTLDGLAYLATDPVFILPKGDPLPKTEAKLELARDLPLIEWLRENVDGSPTIVEAVGPSYYWSGRMTMYTGLPAVVGWDWHQVQQRGKLSTQVHPRRRETAKFYAETDPEAARRYLRRYDVSYVVMGEMERAVSTPESRSLIASLQGLEEVFRSGDDAIYRVDKAALAVGQTP